MSDNEVALTDAQWLALYEHLSAIRKSLAFLVAVALLGVIGGVLLILMAALSA